MLITYINGQQSQDIKIQTNIISENNFAICSI